MKSKKLQLGEGFRIALGNQRSQAVEVVLAPGVIEGGSDNRHRDSDQWLYVPFGLARRL
jgi:hypothetical protein